MKAHNIGKAAIGLLVVLVTLAGARASAAVDSALVGVWVNAQGGPMGVSMTRMLELTADGGYLMSHPVPRGAAPTGAFPDYGRFSAADGAWTMQSEARKATDGGSYAVQADGTLLLKGGKLPEKWTRSGVVANFGLKRSGSQFIPTGAAALARSVMDTVARPWSADAQLTALSVFWVPPQDRGVDILVFLDFHSAAKDAVLRLQVRQFSWERAEHRGDKTPQAILPMAFIDFPVALERARAQGLHGTVNSAQLQWDHVPTIRRFIDGLIDSALRWQWLEDCNRKESEGPFGCLEGPPNSSNFPAFPAQQDVPGLGFLWVVTPETGDEIAIPALSK
jgi:hypothetical protein